MEPATATAIGLALAALSGGGAIALWWEEHQRRRFEEVLRMTMPHGVNESVRVLVKPIQTIIRKWMKDRLHNILHLPGRMLDLCGYILEVLCRTARKHTHRSEWWNELRPAHYELVRHFIEIVKPFVQHVRTSDVELPSHAIFWRDGEREKAGYEIYAVFDMTEERDPPHPGGANGARGGRYPAHGFRRTARLGIKDQWKKAA